MGKIVTWIVVADHQHLRVFSHDGPGRGIESVGRMTLDKHLEPSRDMTTDRPGRKPASGGAMRAMTPAVDPHREAGKQFIADVASSLAATAKEKAYARLVLVAPPRALGELRQALPAEVRKLVVAEIDEDLTKADENDLANHLADVLAV